MQYEIGCVFILKRTDGKFFFGKCSPRHPSKEILGIRKSSVRLFEYFLTGSPKSLVSDARYFSGVSLKNKDQWIDVDEEKMEEFISSIVVGFNEKLRTRFPEWFLNFKKRKEELFSTGRISIPKSYLIQRSLVDLYYFKTGRSVRPISEIKLAKEIYSYCGVIIEKSELRDYLLESGYITTTAYGGVKYLFWRR